MKEMTVQELKALRESGKPHQLIDVREQHEYDRANLGGELIPMGHILSKTQAIKRDCPVVVHCRSGKRSAGAIQALEGQFGYDNLYNLKGGILAWKEAFDQSLDAE